MKIIKKDIQFEVDPMTGDNDGWGFWNHVANDVWEPHTWDILYKYLSKDHTYVDVGAWVGPTVLFGAQLSKRCVAFEPDPHAYQALQTNLKLNSQIANVETHEMAIANVSGSISMGTNTKQGDSMSSMLFSNSSWTVDALTLRDAFEKFQINDCNFIKMDIEGGEAMVLPSIKDFLHSFRPTFYLALHTPWIHDKEAFFNNVKDVLSGYKYIYDANGNVLDLNEINKLTHFAEILATNIEQ